MRTISSFRSVGVFAPPLNSGLPFWSTPLFAGKMPAFSSAAEFGEIMQEGMILPGNGEPCTIPAGAPPGQLANSTDGATCEADGTRIGVEMELRLPP